jgi:hypothetical protein
MSRIEWMKVSVQEAWSVCASRELVFCFVQRRTRLQWMSAREPPEQERYLAWYDKYLKNEQPKTSAAPGEKAARR